MDGVPIVTKHCEPTVRDFMMQGHFKIGSHAHFSKGEQAGLLSDTSEGVGLTRVPFPLPGLPVNARIGTNTFSNITMEGGDLFGFAEQVNSLLFCTSQGPYNEARHRQIITGNTDNSYGANPKFTAYITLDVAKLLLALTALGKALFDTDTKWISRPVQYGERERVLELFHIDGISNSELAKRAAQQAFIKPKRFLVEDEYRFMMEPVPGIRIPDAVYTNTFADGLAELFKSALIETGEFGKPAHIIRS